MIFDKTENICLYSGISKRLDKAIGFLNETDISTIKPGRYDISGDDVFALVHEYETNPFEKSVWEGHRRFIDLQIMISGREKLGYANIEKIEITENFPENGDYIGKGEGNYLEFAQGYFSILFPDDAHMPGVNYSEKSEAVKKIVIKIRVK